uniref:uncharacterized protein LOC118542162 n=1 Tax=Halichoerus grypus TaxID=9711 RepID=UPI0016598911|nr:uncharacterized protein LOC118542162 [Halichoerus grypus]
MQENQWLERSRPIPLCLRHRRLVVIPFPPMPLNFPGEKSQAKVWQECLSLNIPTRICGLLAKCISLWMEMSKPTARLLLSAEISDMLLVGISPLASGFYSHRTQQGILFAAYKLKPHHWAGNNEESGKNTVHFSFKGGASSSGFNGNLIWFLEGNKDMSGSKGTHPGGATAETGGPQPRLWGDDRSIIISGLVYVISNLTELDKCSVVIITISRKSHFLEQTGREMKKQEYDFLQRLFPTQTQ